MLWLGFEPGPSGWKVQTNPHSHGGPGFVVMSWSWLPITAVFSSGKGITNGLSYSSIFYMLRKLFCPSVL